jgi:predicted Rossmann-fold nucleotide-binding protein
MGQIIGSTAQIVGSMIGSGARKREQKAANAEFQADKNNFRNFQLTNEFAGMENTYEDLTVNQQASQFQAQQTDAALAQGLDAIVAGGGGGGGAQAIAQAALQSKQGISASIAQQEQANQAMQAQEASRIQMTQANARDDLQFRQYDRSQQLLNMSAERKNQADAARAQATSALIGGIGNVVGGIATGGLGELAGAVGSGVDSVKKMVNRKSIIADERNQMTQRNALENMQQSQIGG